MEPLALRLAFVVIEVALMIIAIDLVAASDDMPVRMWIGLSMLGVTLANAVAYFVLIGRL